MTIETDFTPKEFLTSFIAEKLGGDINKLGTFSLHDLWQDKVYGCPGRKYDDDDTNLMRAIYLIVFPDAWPMMNKETLANYTYRGDTMNSFRTLFGNAGKSSPHEGLDRFNPPDGLGDRVVDFHENYCATIGNMMVLPNLVASVPVNHRICKKDAETQQLEWKDNWSWEPQTINMYRGIHWRWHDFMDLFLTDLRELLITGKCEDKYLHRFIDANKEAFEPYRGIDGWRSFIDLNLLQGYVNDDYSIAHHSKGYFYWKTWDMTREQYLQEADEYIRFADGLISERSKQIIEKLKTKLY